MRRTSAWLVVGLLLLFFPSLLDGRKPKKKSALEQELERRKNRKAAREQFKRDAEKRERQARESLGLETTTSLEEANRVGGSGNRNSGGGGGGAPPVFDGFDYWDAVAPNEGPLGIELSQSLLVINILKDRLGKALKWAMAAASRRATSW